MARKISACIVLSLVLLLTGCGDKPSDLFGVLSGALAWSRQDWPAAASSFLRTAETASASKNTRLEEYAVYGLASTYLAQDEYDSALERLASLAKSASPDICSGIWYQAGIIAFRKGDFSKSSELFRKSLEYDSARQDAKLNLELSKRSLQEKPAEQSSSSSGFHDNGGDSEDSNTIFNLIKKKEQDRWKNQKEEKPRQAVADY